MNMTIWRKIRYILFCLGLIQGFYMATTEPPEELAQNKVLVIFVIIISSLFVPIVLILGMMIQAINPLQDKKWTIPNMDSNFLNLKNPLHFFHAAGYIFLFVLIGILAGFLFSQNLSSLIYAIAFLSAYAGIKLGIKMCIKLFPKKFEDKTCAQIDSTESMEDTGLNAGKTKKSIRIIVYILAASGILSIIIGLFFFISTQKFTGKAVECKGKIVAHDEESSNGSMVYYPIFEFEDSNGQKHTGRSAYGSNPASFKVGEPVAILYDPQNPQKAKINSFMNLYGIPVLLAGTGIANIVLGVLTFYLGPLIFLRKK